MKMYHAARLIALLILSINTTHFAPAQNKDSTAADASLEDLINLKAQTEASGLQQILNQNVAASSRKALSSRETPGIVTVITEEEIRYSGARDIIDLLRFVPGMDFATDLAFVVGVGIRGNWAAEGKVLLLVDGQEYNEILYQSIPFGNKFPLEQIARIEIIRGPGSAVYGGTAEFGVINIITKGAAGQQFASASGTYSALPGSYGRRYISAGLSKAIGSRAHADVSFFKGQNIAADQPYYDYYAGTEQNPQPVDAVRHSATDATNLNIGLRYGTTQVRAIYDRYHLEHPRYLTDFSHLFLSVKNNISLGRRITITPTLSYTNQTPWETTDAADVESGPYFRINARRSKASVTTLYDISRKVNLTFGMEYFNDFALNKIGEDYFGENQNQVSYHTASLFAQGLVKHRVANLTLGFRYDNHSAFGSAFVPRFALTKRIDNFHFKALYSHAYRAPGILNINLNSAIRPERSQVSELELGYQFTPDMLLSVNAFDVQTRDVIIYFSDSPNDSTYIENYLNYDRSGSRGLEAVYQIRKTRWNLNLGYSFYRGLSNSTADAYRVPGQPNVYLAFPAHKITLQGSFSPVRNLRLSPSVLYFSERFGYTSLTQDATPALTRSAPHALVNLYMSYDNLLLKGLDLGVGAYNLLNSRQSMFRAYQGEIDPIPGRSRELLLKLTYHLPFQSPSSSKK
jgi:outer membrane cobalamin receptor